MKTSTAIPVDPYHRPTLNKDRAPAQFVDFFHIPKAKPLTREDFQTFIGMLKEAGHHVSEVSPTFADIYKVEGASTPVLVAQIKLSEGLIGTTDTIPGFTVQPYYHGALRYSVCI